MIVDRWGPLFDPAEVRAELVGRRVSGTPHGDHDHDHFGPADAAALASHEGTRATWISLGLLTLTAAIQLGVVAISGSVALLADTIHNLTDALTAIPLLIAFRLARQPPTRRYPYGYHRAEDVAGLVIVAFIVVSAVVAAVEAVHRLMHPQPVTAAGWVLAAGALGFLGNEAVAPTGSASASGSVPRRSSPTGCTPAPTGSRRSGWWPPRSAC